MDPLAFGSAHPLLACILFLLTWAAISTIALWPFSRARIVDRLPFVLCVVSILLALAVNLLPEAFPRFFDVMIGHSIYATETRGDPGGTQTVVRWIERWEDGTAGLFLWIPIVGVIWAVVNLVKGRALIANGLAVGFTMWWLFQAFRHFTG